VPTGPARWPACWPAPACASGTWRATPPVRAAFFGLGEAGADLRWFGIDPVAAGVFGVPVGCMVLVLVSLLTRPPAPEERAWWPSGCASPTPGLSEPTARVRLPRYNRGLSLKLTTG
jgi:hypothetical protein